MKQKCICLIIPALPLLFSLSNCCLISSPSIKDGSPVEKSEVSKPTIIQCGHSGRESVETDSLVYQYAVNERSRRIYRDVMNAIDGCTDIDVYKVNYYTGEERLIKHIDSISKLAQIRQIIHESGTMYERTRRPVMCVSTTTYYSVRFKKKGIEAFSLSIKEAVDECYYLKSKDTLFISILDLLISL